MKIACVGYRSWALNIYDFLSRNTDHVYLIFRSKAQFNERILKDFSPDIILFYGWSWYVPNELLMQFKCLMLHPSPLPKYRGGSPIQNQIISGEKASKISIFIMNHEIDSGDLVGQEDISLEGSLADIFKRIEEAGKQVTLRILNEGLKPVPQKHSEATIFKRRGSEESEITMEELRNSTAGYLYNKIRMLNDPYPNAFIKTFDGKRLYILTAKVDDKP